MKEFLQSKKNILFISFVFIILYGLAYLLFFWQTPLGQTPVLDGTENILLSKQIATKSLPNEPFFRSMLYPALLAIPVLLGFETTDELFVIASLFGMIFHFFNVICIFFIVKNLWKSNKPAIISALLYGLYPPAIFFAAEPLDTTISIFFLLIALFFFFKAIDFQKRKDFILSGFFLGIACLLRSNLLPFAFIYITNLIIIIFKLRASDTPNNDPFLKVESQADTPQQIVGVLASGNETDGAVAVGNGDRGIFYNPLVKNTLLSIFVFIFMIILGGIACYIHSGEFRLLPWQGAANYYSANSLNANGKFYKHSIYLPNRSQGVNPARLESEIIYASETGNKPPFDLNDFNKFWLKKSFSEITSNPKHWVFLNLKKIYYLFNNYEQYNNKTFSFHKKMSSVLCYNPLCYGILVILFLLTISSLNDKLQRKILFNQIILLSGIVTLSLGIIGFYVSARFRLPLAPLLVIFSSYIFSLNFKQIINKKNLIIILVGILVTFSSFFDVSDTSTYKEDMLLNAFACSRLGLDEEVIGWSDKVFVEAPYNIQAIRLKMVAFINLALSGKISDRKEWERVLLELKYLNKNKIIFDDTLLLQGCFAFKFEKNKEKAKSFWLDCCAESKQPELYRAFLIYAGLIEPIEQDFKMAESMPLLAVALNKTNNSYKLKISDDLYICLRKAFSFLLD